MEFSTMRTIDRWVGEPLCRALSLAARMGRFLGGKGEVPPPDKVGSVLVMKFVGIGAIAEAVPMFRAMRRHYPGARISILTFEWGAGLVRLLGFDEVRVIRTDSPLHFLADTASAAWWGWRSGFTVTHDLEFLSSYSALLSFLVHSPRRVGFSNPRSARGGLFTAGVAPIPGNHLLYSFMSQMGWGPADLVPEDSAEVGVPPEADLEAERLLQKAGLFGAPRLVTVNMNTGEMAGLSLWSLTYHSILAVRLHESHRSAIAFIGSPRERQRVDEVLGALPRDVRAANLAGLTRVDTLLAVLKRSSLLVSNESGPLSLAGLVGTPTLGFFGAGAARVYGPRGARSINLDREEHPRCKACQELPGSGGKACPFGMRCVSEITPERAFDSAAKLLGEPD